MPTVNFAIFDQVNWLIDVQSWDKILTFLYIFWFVCVGLCGFLINSKRTANSWENKESKNFYYHYEGVQITINSWGVFESTHYQLWEIFNV